MGQASRIRNRRRRMTDHEIHDWKRAKSLAAWLMFSLVFCLGVLAAVMVGAVIYAFTS